jgi:outer membrane protein
MTALNGISTRIALLALLTAPFASHAQDEKPREGGWGIGLGVAVWDTLYAGEGNRAQPFPLVTYEGEHIYLKAASVGYKFIDNDTVTFSAFVAARVDGIDAKDFGRRELADRGIDRDLLEDRDLAADLGLSAVLKTESAGEFEFDVRGDATGTSKGYQASIDYRYPLALGSVTLIPSVGVVSLSDKLANYYYGTLPEEVARGVIDYRPGSTTIARTSLTAIVPTGEHWTLIGSISADAYPNKITDSPLVDADSGVVPVVFLGAIRNF